MTRGRSTAHVGGMGLQRTTDQQLDEASDGLPAHRGSTFKRNAAAKKMQRQNAANFAR